MDRSVLDFETRCDLDLTQVGAYKYVQHESFEVVLLGIKCGTSDTIVGPPDMFTLVDLLDIEYIYAHNAYFDWLVYCRVYKQFNWPGEFTDLSRWIDTMALAARYTLPLSLADAGKALGLPIQKQIGGKALIKKICCPPYKHTQEDMTKFISYCHDDVESTYALIKALPHSELSEQEQKLWVLTQKMNIRGLPIDLKTADAVVKTVDMFLEAQQENLPDLTDGKITKVTQYQRMKKFAHEKGVMIPNTQHATLGEWIEKDIPQEVKDVLTLRYEFGSSTTNKFRVIRKYHTKGRIHDYLCYYGAQRTGRWAGRGFQIHNLPRASVDCPEDFIEKFRNYEYIENPVEIAKTLVRAMINAPKDHMLIVSDFSSVENRDLAWNAQDEKTLNLFKNGLDQYVDMASFLFNVPYDDITKDQRFMGKTIILGCGYGMGHKLFQATALGYGISLTLAEAKHAVDAFRTRYKLIARFWYGLYKKAVLAVKHEGVSFEYNGIKLKRIKDRTGRSWLAMFLHSGRPLLYMQPEVRQGKYGEEITHMGVSKRWGRFALIPGRMTGHVCQGECRDLLGHGLLNIEDKMPEVQTIGMVHDEGIGIIHKKDITDDTLDKYNRLICNTPSWAKGLPLEAEGYIAKRYKKG